MPFIYQQGSKNADFMRSRVLVEPNRHHKISPSIFSQDCFVPAARTLSQVYPGGTTATPVEGDYDYVYGDYGVIIVLDYAAVGSAPEGEAVAVIVGGGGTLLPVQPQSPTVVTDEEIPVGMIEIGTGGEDQGV